ncbi:MAG: ribonuclease J [Actinobacteria bacterium]|nr:ribonuclease J [Actinomycetota bacterium]
MTFSQIELPTPPPLTDDTFRVVALGGLGDIGRNMTVLEYRGKLLIVDCGVLFPEETQPGVDLILPDFAYIQDRLDDVAAVILTHGHEDHIGAVPYLLRHKQDIPIVGSQLTLAFIESKLKEHRITAYTHAVKEGMTEKFGDFSVEFIAVNHSIPDALAVAVTTDAGTILITGDFKMDQLPLDGRVTDLNAFARLGDQGVDLFLVDSTNAEVPGFVTSEKDIIPTLQQVIGGASGRVIVASFASHVHRVQQIIDVAVRNNRKIAFVGRSMVRNMALASDLGYLTIPGGALISSDEMADLPDDQAVLICTGSQGEPMAALARIANQDHAISVGPGDTVILASSLIPGNENAVYRIINDLTRLGAHVVHKGNALVHVSGHAAAGELLYCYNIVKPKNVMPIHGEWRHLRANADLAIKTGVPESRVMLAGDGIVVDLVNGKANIVGAVPCGYVYVEGSTVGEVSESLLNDRRVLGEDGFLSIVAAIDFAERKVIAGPQIHARGFSKEESVFEEILPKIKSTLEAALADGVTDTHQLGQMVRRVAGKWVGEKHRRRPMIVPLIISN